MSPHLSYGDLSPEIMEQARLAPWGQAEGIIKRERERLKRIAKQAQKDKALSQALSDIRVSPRRRGPHGS